MIRIYCDFDGTVCPQDVGEQFFKNFAGERAEADVQQLLAGEITMQQWLTRLANAIPAAPMEKFMSFVDQFVLDPYFAGFARICQERHVPLTILSDGLDFYIDRILRRSGLNDVLFFANRGEFIPVSGGVRLSVSFPYTDAECSLCGNCKRNHILTSSADDDIIIYVGDGYSDRCPVRYADVVLAKRQLIKHCQEQNITYTTFNHFADVQKHVEELLQRKRLRHRQEASMARREIFMQG
jgi:2-hydroxy-3-keto-5-methylthiopentenyl-1-phosphate phosphatase